MADAWTKFAAQLATRMGTLVNIDADHVRLVCSRINMLSDLAFVYVLASTDC